MEELPSQATRARFSVPGSVEILFLASCDDLPAGRDTRTSPGNGKSYSGTARNRVDVIAWIKIEHER